MGYYIETDSTRNKAQWLVKNAGGQIVSLETARSSMSDLTKGVVCVVDNGMFEAAGFCFSMAEFDAFTDSQDTRPRKYVVMDREIAKKMSGYNLK